MFMVRKISISIFFIIGIFVIAQTQNAFRSGDGWGAGWGTSDYWLGTGFGTTFGKTYQNTAGSGNRYFRLYTDWSGQTREHGPSGGNDILLPLNTGISLQTWGGSKAYFINVGNSSFNYIFRTKQGDGINNSPEVVVFEVQGEIRNVSLVSQLPASSGVTAASSVAITANTSGVLSNGQGVYLRYTTNNWASSTILPMTGSNITYNATIPALPSGTNVKYYIFTSGAGLTIPHQNADWFTINGNTNNSNNFQYTVLAGSSAVSVMPSNPMDNVPVTISFDATGTDLAGASKVYLHSGVSATLSNPTLFQYTIGNWGQDDGLGEMTNTGTNTWTITLASLRSYYNVPQDKDVFGLNMLFRNANGTLKEDFNGQNYYSTTNPGNFFNITFPATTIHFAPSGQTFNLAATANIAPATWALVEIDPLTNADLNVLNVTNGGITYSNPINVPDTQLRKYKLTADFSGLLKSKTFEVVGYNAVAEAPRPGWANPGINYHANDPTKATLILHAPTYTRYKR